MKKINKSNKSLALVKWVSNLGITTEIKLYNKEIRKMISLPSIQISVLIGLILSDGLLVLTKKKTRKN